MLGIHDILLIFAKLFRKGSRRKGKLNIYGGFPK